MKSYSFLSKIPFLKRSFTLKTFFIAFVGTHIPLVGIILFLLSSPQAQQNPLWMGGLTLVLTLVATGITLYALNGLLQPILTTNQALKNYINHSKIPTLPSQHTDEVGQLMSDVQSTILKLEEFEEQRLSSVQLLSHDLQRPAKNVLGLIEVLKIDQSPENIKSSLDLMEQSIRSQIAEMEYLINSIKKKKNNLQNEIEVSVIRLDDFFQKINDKFRLSLREKNLDLSISGDTSSHIEVAELPLYRSAINVLSNAIKYSPNHKTIAIQSTVCNQFIRLSITDKGDGFSPKDKDKIFKYNATLDRNFNAKEDSHGIGLHLCQKLVSRAKGEITAHSDGAGLGATFTIKLPIVHVPELEQVA